MSSNSLYKNNSITLGTLNPIPILKDLHEFLGVLESIEPAGDGLLQIRIAGLGRSSVPEELEGQLRGLMRRRRSDAL